MKKTLPLMMLAAMAFAPAAFSAPAGTLSVHVLDQQTGMPPADVTRDSQKNADHDQLLAFNVSIPLDKFLPQDRKSVV